MTKPLNPVYSNASLIFTNFLFYGLSEVFALYFVTYLNLIYFFVYIMNVIIVTKIYKLDQIEKDESDSINYN